MITIEMAYCRVSRWFTLKKYLPVIDPLRDTVVSERNEGTVEEGAVSEKGSKATEGKSFYNVSLLLHSRSYC